MIDLQGSAYRDDDGSADPTVRALLSTGDGNAIAETLKASRLLVAVVARLDVGDEDGREQDSHMALVSMLNERGERGLLAFTGTDSLAAWDPEARPVPAPATAIAHAALDDGAAAVVVDVAGPHQVVIPREVLVDWCADTGGAGGW
ncbi:MAG: SseB family protein [Actinomycetota bacterium]